MPWYALLSYKPEERPALDLPDDPTKVKPPPFEHPLDALEHAIKTAEANGTPIDQEQIDLWRRTFVPKGQKPREPEPEPKPKPRRKRGKK
jgi:hypothetical protein